MAEDNRIQMPQSGGGLINYSSDTKSKIRYSPWVVVGLIVFIIILEFFLHRSGFLG